MWAAAVAGQVFVFSVLAFAQTPTLVYSDSLAAPGEPGNGFKIQYGGAMGTGTLSGNLLTLRMTYPHGTTVSSIADTFSDIYTLGVSTDSGSGGWVTALYYLAGAPAGITQITVTYSSSVADWHGALQEYSGVATSSPGDGICSNHTTASQCSAAISTTSNNDLIVASTIGLSYEIYENTSSSIAPGGGFILDSADTQCSDADEEFVQPSAGLVTPSFTIGGNSEAFNIIAMAFKAATAGTNPTGMYILHQQHVDINGPNSSENVYFVSTGNLLLAATDVGPSTTTVTISNCSPSNTFAEKTQGSLWPQFFYLTSGANFSTNLYCTVSTTQQGQHAILVIYDVVGAATSPFGSLGPEGSGNGSPVTNAVTPTTQPGIAFAAENSGIGPGSSMNYLWDNTPYTGESDAGQMNNGDGWAHEFYTSTSQLTFSWGQADTGSYMQADAIAFESGTTGPPPTVVVTISPTSDSMNVNTTLQFTSTVTGSTDTAVTWSTTCGTINSSGMYTAPAAASSCMVTATSVANAADSASASMTVIAGSPPPPTVVVTISPTSGSINVNTTLQFTSTVTGSTDTAVTWSTTCGTINSSGMYTAPAAASSCMVTATSVANAADSASASMTVIAGSPPPTVVVTISPTSDSMNVNTTLQFTSTVTGSTDTAVTWSTTCGTINSSGMYTAPAAASSCIVTATSLANAADSASASVTVIAGSPPPPTVVVTISPTSDSINVNTTLQFTSTVTGSTDTAVTWSTTCGTINSRGKYTAPAAASSCMVTATSKANAADSASASVTVTASRRHH